MNSSKKSYIDYYASREIPRLSTKCIKSLSDLYTFLHDIDDSDFDDLDKSELQCDKNRVTQIIRELNANFCVEQATKLHLSYGEYMALKHEGRV